MATPPSSSGAGILSGMFDDVNSALNNFSQSFSAGIASEIAPLVAGGMTLTFIFMGLLAIRGMLDRPFSEVAWMLFKASVISTIALTSTIYQSYIIDVFLTLPDDLVASVVGSSVQGTSVATGQNAAKAIEEIYDLGSYNAGLFFDQASIGVTGVSFMPVVYGLLVWLGTLLCVIMGTLWLFIAKVVLALMLGVGPIFICCLIWNPTQQFFWSWVGQILNTVFTSILVLAVFAIFAAIFKNQLTALEIAEDTANFAQTATFAFMGVLCMGVLMQIPHYVGALTGAAGGAVGTAMGKITGGAISMGTGAAGGVAAGIRGGFSANAAKNAYQESRAGGASRFQAARSARHEFNKSNQEMKQGYPDYFRKGLTDSGNKHQSAPTVPYHAGGAKVNFAQANVATGSKYGNKS